MLYGEQIPEFKEDVTLPAADDLLTVNAFGQYCLAKGPHAGTPLDDLGDKQIIVKTRTVMPEPHPSTWFEEVEGIWVLE